MNTQSEHKTLKEKYQQLELELAAARKEIDYLTTENTRLIEARNSGNSTNNLANTKPNNVPLYWDELLSKIYENSHSAILIFNTTKHEVVSVNKRAIELFEAESTSQFHSSYQPELEFVKTTEKDLAALYSQVKEKGKASRLFHYKTFKGRPFWGLCQIQSFDFNNESILAIRISDINEHLKEKEVSEAIISTYYQLTDSINNIAIITFNTDFVCTLMSGQYAEKINLNSKYCVGKHISDIAHPEFLEKNINALQIAKKGKSETYYFLFNNCYTQADIVPIKNNKNEVLNIMVLLQDRTIEYQREQTLLLNEELLNGSFMESPVAMALVDIESGEFIKKNNFSNKLFHKYQIPQQFTYFQLIKSLPFDNPILQDQLLGLKKNNSFYEQAKFNFPNTTPGYLQIAMRKINIGDKKYALFILTDISEIIIKQQELQDSRELLNALYQNTSFGLLLIRKSDLVIKGANSTILGYINKRNELDVIGEVFEKPFGELLSTLNRSAFKLLNNSSESIKGETSGTDAYGNNKHFSFEITKINQNEIEYYLINISDNTDKIKHELQLLENKNLLKIVVESSPFQTFLCEGDELNIIMANKSGYTALGYNSYEEIKGVSLVDWSRIIHPKDKSKWDNALINNIEGSIEVEVQLPISESTNWFEVYISNIKTESGKLTLIKGINITEKKALLNELFRSQQIITEIFNQSTDAIFVRNARNNDEIICNQVALDLFDAESKTQFASKLISDYAADEITPERELEFQNRLLTKGYSKEDFHFKSLKGRTFWGYTRVKTFSVEDELYILYIVTDISEFKEKAKLLEENEKNFKQLFYNNPQAMFIVESDSEVIIDANNAALKQYGYVTENFIGREISLLGGCNTKCLEFDEETQIENYGTVSHKKADGTEIFVDLKKTSILRSAPGNYKLCIASDITKLKVIENELIQSKFYLENIINTDPNPIFVKDLQGNMVLVNKSFARVANKKIEDIINKNERDLYPPNELAFFKETDNLVLKSNKLCSFEQNDVNTPFQKNQHFITYKTPLVLQDNKVNILGVMVDITSQKEAELEMARRGQLFNFVFNNSTDALFIVDTSTDLIMDVNERTLQMFGYGSKNDFIGKDGTRLQVRDFTNDELKSIQNDIELSGGFSREVEYERRDRTTFWGSLAGSVFMVGGKKYYLIRVLDIQKSREYQDALANSVHEKEILIKEVHHRVKNNMAVISGLLQLQSSYFKDKATREAFKEAQNRIKGMALIHEMLYQTDSLTHINFGRYINTLVGNIQRSMEQHCPIYVNLDISNDTIDLISAVPCGLIINELITNCYKHAFMDRPKGTIWITYKLVENNYIITVTDDGIGLPAEKLELKKQNSLGMILITELTRQLKGEILLVSENGTKYTLTFPQKEESK
jgi:PAS domain S-box-containing protein